MAFDSKKIIVIDATNPAYKLAISSAGRASVINADMNFTDDALRVHIDSGSCGVSDSGFYPVPVYRDWPGTQLSQYATGSLAGSPASVTLSSLALTDNQNRLEQIKVSVQGGPVRVQVQRQTAAAVYTTDFVLYLGAASGSNLRYADNWEWNNDFSGLFNVLKGRIFRAIFDTNLNNGTVGVSVLWVYRGSVS